MKPLDFLKLFFASGVFATDLTALNIIKQASSISPALLLSDTLTKYQIALNGLQKLGLAFALGFVATFGYDVWRCGNGNKG